MTPKRTEKNAAKLEAPPSSETTTADIELL